MEYESIATMIENYMEFFRRQFPGKILQKQHIFEDHIMPWLRKWEVGLRRYIKMGCERVHKQFNRLMVTHSGISNESPAIRAHTSVLTR